MKSKLAKKMQWVGALLVIGALAVPWTAFADNVIGHINDVESDSGSTVEAGASVTAKYWIVANNGDDQDGCNASDGSPAIVALDVPSGVQATPSSLSFAACGIEHAQYVSFQSVNAGKYQITTSVSDNGEGSYNTTPSKILLNVVESSSADTSAPVITPVVSGTLGQNEWYVSDVNVSFSVVDNESAVSSKSGCDAQLVNEDTAGVTFTCSATSAGGTAKASVTVKRDATAPQVSIQNVSDFYYGFAPLTGPSFSASDAMSGIAFSGMTGYEPNGLPGGRTLTATATDFAGNSATATAGYSIGAWTIKGFYQPVDMGNVLNTVKNGSTVPMKFEIFAGATELTDTAAAVKSIGAIRSACSGLVEDAVEILATGGTSLRYDATSGQFIYNWQTPKNVGECYKVTMTAQDGSSIVASFKLK